MLFGRMKNCGAPSFVVYSIGCLHTNWLTTNILSSLEDEAASLNFSNEPTIFLHTGFSSNKIVVGILKRYCCFLLCFLLHSLPRCFLIVKESRSGHSTSTLFTHTLLLIGRWSRLRPLANIYTYLFFWPNRPRANWLSRKNYYSLSHFSPSVDSLSLSLSLSLHTEFSSSHFLSIKIYSFTDDPSQL